MLPHNAAVANIVAGWFPYATFQRKQFGIGEKEALIPDWTMTIDGVVYHGEYDAAHERHKVFQAKIAQYRQIIRTTQDDNLLIVTGDPERAENLLEIAKDIPTACVATLGDVLKYPWRDDAEESRIWRVPEEDGCINIKQPLQTIVERLYGRKEELSAGTLVTPMTCIQEK